MDDQRTGNIYTVYIKDVPTHGSETDYHLRIIRTLMDLKTRRSSKTYCLLGIMWDLRKQ
jgi:hypothetical protein